MATGSSYKEEVHPFASERKFFLFSFVGNFEEKFYFKARNVPRTTTSIPMVNTGCKFK